MDFSDDLALLCYSYDNQEELTDALARAAGTVGLLISASKTKLVNVNVGKGTVKLNGEGLEIVEEFTYLGSKMSADGNTIREVRTRIAKAAVAFNSLNNIWKNQNIIQFTEQHLEKPKH